MRTVRAPQAGEQDLDPLGLLRSRAVRHALCDFCGQRLGGFWRRFECSDFTRQLHGPRGKVPAHFLSWWGACLPCARLVEDRDWRALLDRVVPAFERRTGAMSPALRAVFRSEVGAMYLQLERHLTGRSCTVGERR